MKRQINENSHSEANIKDGSYDMIMKTSSNIWNVYKIIIDDDKQEPETTNEMCPDVQTLICPHKYAVEEAINSYYQRLNIESSLYCV